MAPRSVLLWTIPTLAIIISVLWFRRKRFQNKKPGLSKKDTLYKDCESVSANIPPEGKFIDSGQNIQSCSSSCKASQVNFDIQVDTSDIKTENLAKIVCDHSITESVDKITVSTGTPEFLNIPDYNSLENKLESTSDFIDLTDKTDFDDETCVGNSFSADDSVEFLSDYCKSNNSTIVLSDTSTDQSISQLFHSSESQPCLKVKSVLKEDTPKDSVNFENIKDKKKSEYLCAIVDQPTLIDITSEDSFDELEDLKVSSCKKFQAEEVHSIVTTNYCTQNQNTDSEGTEETDINPVSSDSDISADPSSVVCVVSNSYCEIGDPSFNTSILPEESEISKAESNLSTTKITNIKCESNNSDTKSSMQQLDSPAINSEHKYNLSDNLEEPHSISWSFEKPASIENNVSEMGSETRNMAQDKDESADPSKEDRRDSANHSPAEVMLGSPSLSNYSDVHSEGSSDSGKGCSVVRTPGSGTSMNGDPPPSLYEFVLPQHLVGRLIGRHGCFVHQIKAETNASILIKRHPDTTKMKICAVEGTQSEIDSALAMIRQKFPQKRYPSITLEQVCFVPLIPMINLPPESMQLMLVEGINNDVTVSSLVTPAHFFVQQPTHPTFPALARLLSCMNMCYSEPSAPPLPTPTESMICAAPAMGGWFRAQIIAVDNENGSCDVKFVDYGGYLTVQTEVLRQIRHDFMTLPFQAIECYLANVAPMLDGEWSSEAVQCVEDLTRGQIIQAQIYDYTEDGIPIVSLYSFQGHQVVAVNQELVNQSLAQWVQPMDA